MPSNGRHGLSWVCKILIAHLMLLNINANSLFFKNIIHTRHSLVLFYEIMHEIKEDIDAFD